MTKMNIKSILLLVLLIFCKSNLHAQVSVNTSGNNATGSGGSVNYSIGQTTYTTNNGVNGSSAQGVQHAMEIFTVGIEETLHCIKLFAFPNPTSENLFLRFSSFPNEPFYYELFDTNGKKLLTDKIESQISQINTCNFSSGTYYIHIKDATHQKVQSFKIIKK